MPSPALVVATLALFVALGGTGYAVTQLPKNSVTTVQVKNGSLRTEDMRVEDVATLRGKVGAVGPMGPKGDPGARGAQGETGPQGQPGETGARYVLDGSGAVVGDLVSRQVEYNGALYMVYIAPNYWWLLGDGSVWEKDLSGDGAGSLVWTDAACTGIPVYIDTVVGSPVARLPGPYGLFQVNTPAGMRAYRSAGWGHAAWTAGHAYYKYVGGTCTASSVFAGTTYVVNDLVNVPTPSIAGPLSVS